MDEYLHRWPRYFTAASNPQARPIPEGLWHKCPGCAELTYVKQWKKSFRVCPRCEHHDRLTAGERVELLLDPASWQEYDGDLCPGDPLGFVSPKDNYAKKLESLHSSLSMLDAAMCGVGRIEDRPLGLCASEFPFMGGSMGSVVGEKIARSAERATDLRIPLVTINASGVPACTRVF